MQCKPLDRGFNVAVQTIANRLFPCGFDVADNAPNTIPELVSAWQDGRPIVWNSASDQTIFADAETNFAFRAWHDHCHLRPIFRGRENTNPAKYVTGPLNGQTVTVKWNPDFANQFDEQGEFATLNEQKRDLVALYGRTDRVRQWCAILDAKITGQFRYKQINDEFPTNQMRFVRAYLELPESALSIIW